MAEVLSKAEKTLPRKRRKVRARKSENEALRGEETGIDPHEGIERTENDLQRDEATLGTSWAHLRPVATAISTSKIHPLDGLGVTSPT